MVPAPTKKCAPDFRGAPGSVGKEEPSESVADGELQVGQHAAVSKRVRDLIHNGGIRGAAGGSDDGTRGVQATNVKADGHALHRTGTESNANVSHGVVSVAEVVGVVGIIDVGQRAFDAADANAHIEANPIVVFERAVIEEDAHPVGLSGTGEGGTSDFLVDGVVSGKTAEAHLDRGLFGQVVGEAERGAERAQAHAHAVGGGLFCVVLLRLAVGGEGSRDEKSGSELQNSDHGIGFV